MAKQKTILFACGTGIATSTAVNAAVTEEMKKRGLFFNAMQAKATEVPSLADGVDYTFWTFGGEVLAFADVVFQIEQFLAPVLEEFDQLPISHPHRRAGRAALVALRK